MKTFQIPPMRWYMSVADVLMVPVMFVLRGFRADSLQETHSWHVYRIDPADVDPALCVECQGSDATVYNGRYSFLFHAPIFGGWKKYSVYEVDRVETPFFIGWIARDVQSGKVLDAAVQKKPIHDNRIRMLDGPPSYLTTFFALDNKGQQVLLRRVGQGKIGDKQYTSVRLF